jgi:EAL domain-containing protein (putative c-di-GMP-specific phosphodiesterase class I)
LLLLKHPHLDEVKLSCALARTVDSKGFDEAMILSLQSYCDSIKMPFVVPSIGSGAGFSKLKELGIQHFQGDLLCPFISAADMEDWLSQYFQSALDG